MDKAVQLAPAGRRVHYERRRPEDTVLYQLVQEHLETFLAQVEAETGAAAASRALDGLFDRIAAKDANVNGGDGSRQGAIAQGNVEIIMSIMSVKASMNNKFPVACLMTVVLWGGPGVSNAWAGGHGGSHGRGGSHGHGGFHKHGWSHRHGGSHRHRGSHGHFGFFIGAPLFWPPPYYPYYDYPYRYPPAVVIERQPQVYIQREPYYWYYCPEPSGYYPYVQNCRRGWQQAVPSAPPQ